MAVVEVVDAQEMEELFGVVQPSLLVKLEREGIEAVHVFVTDALHVFQCRTTEHRIHDTEGQLFILLFVATHQPHS
ncbi:hypothetical protein D3C86_1113430 [compost metagenome]